MRIRLLIDCDGANPNFDRRRPVSPDNHPSRTQPAGTELEHPECWVHCMPDASTGVVRAEPVDDEAMAKVGVETKRRNEILAERARRKLEEEQAKAREATAGTSRRSRSAS